MRRPGPAQAGMSADAVLDVLARAELLTGLTEPELRAVRALGRIVRFPPGVALLSTGRLTDY
jgi:hypothetical protein